MLFLRTLLNIIWLNIIRQILALAKLMLSQIKLSQNEFKPLQLKSRKCEISTVDLRVNREGKNV